MRLLLDGTALVDGLLTGLLGGGAGLRDLLHHGRLGGHQQRHRALLHGRADLDVGHGLALLHDPVELLLRLLRVRDLATAEAHGELDLVAGLEEADGGAGLELEIVIVRLGTELDLLDLDHALLALGLAWPSSFRRT